MGSKTLGVLAAVVSIVAGLYLLTSESAAQQATVFDALMHGIGGYCVARGLWMLATLSQTVRTPPA